MDKYVNNQISHKFSYFGGGASFTDQENKNSGASKIVRTTETRGPEKLGTFVSSQSRDESYNGEHL